jgi:histidine triad (HIT) family protein
LRPRVLVGYRSQANDRGDSVAEDTIFGKILRGEIPSQEVYSDDEYYAFRDIKAQAPHHILIIPRKPIPKISDATEADRKLIGGLILKANEIARKLGFAEDGYRLVINCGKHGGQEVYHLHLHLLGGRQMTWPPG